MVLRSRVNVASSSHQVENWAKLEKKGRIFFISPQWKLELRLLSFLLFHLMLLYKQKWRENLDICQLTTCLRHCTMPHRLYCWLCERSRQRLWWWRWRWYGAVVETPLISTVIKVTFIKNISQNRSKYFCWI